MRNRKLTPSVPPRPSWEYQRTDAGNAELLVGMFANAVRFDHHQKAWYLWREHSWERDAKDNIVNFAIHAARERRLNALLAPQEMRTAEEQWALLSENRTRLMATLELAKAHPRISTVSTDWISDPTLLAVQNGVIDLRLGTLIPGKPEHRIRIHAPVSFDPAASCPLFTNFVKQITMEDDALAKYLQRAIGYSLIGDNPEQIAFICHGEGSNGKTTLLFIVHQLLGEDYATELPASILERGKKYGIPNDLMKLYGRRFATLSEAQEGAVMDESRLKQITGGDLISGRYLYKDFEISFRSVAKIWLAFNHLPTVLDDTIAFWRRPHVIPFSRTFKGKEVDKELRDKLCKELPGILNWAIKGCLDYLQNGLQPPDSVLLAVQEYKSESNPVARFVEECCECSQSYSVASGVLLEAYTAWAANNEEVKPTAKFLATRLNNLGFRSARLGHDRIRGFSGLRMRPNYPFTTDLLEDEDARTDEDEISLKSHHYN